MNLDVLAKIVKDGVVINRFGGTVENPQADDKTAIIGHAVLDKSVLA